MPNDTNAPADPFRRQYRQLTPEEQTRVSIIKDHATGMWTSLERAQAAGADPRCIALAKTKLEEAVFWSTKGITG